LFETIVKKQALLIATADLSLEQRHFRKLNEIMIQRLSQDLTNGSRLLHCFAFLLYYQRALAHQLFQNIQQCGPIAVAIEMPQQLPIEFVKVYPFMSKIRNPGAFLRLKARERIRFGAQPDVQDKARRLRPQLDQEGRNAFEHFGPQYLDIARTGRGVRHG
jgi:hypothetical protein